MDLPFPQIGGAAYDVRWTSPKDQFISVNGDVWMMRNSGATALQHLIIEENGLSFGSHDIPSASRSAVPFTFQSAYGANFLQNVFIAKGQSLDFLVAPSGADLDFVGMNIFVVGQDSFVVGQDSIDNPEPGTLACLLGGLTVIGLRLRRRRT